MSPHRLRIIAATVFTVSACTAEQAPGQSESADSAADGSEEGINLEDAGNEDEEGSDGTASSEEDDGSQTQRLDVMMGAAETMSQAEGGETEGCEKVDFVFVVDSSPSMEDEQDNLITSFPGFISSIEQALAISDFNLMVVDAGALPGSDCEGVLGAGRLTDGQGTDCGVTSGARYATSSQEDLTDVFTCMASRGIEGAMNEETMDALLASVGPLAESGACNEGFLRDDAILVVTIITDEEDDPADRMGMGGFGMPMGEECVAVDNDANSTGSPQSWVDALVAAKDGNETNLVVLGLIGDCDLGGCPAFSFAGNTLTGAEPAPRIREFVTSFTYGTTGPVCAEDYAPFFDDAVSVIQGACDGFTPPVG